MTSTLLTLYSELHDRRHVLTQLVIQQLVLRYRRTVLGYLWTLMNPLMTMSVMAVVFSGLFKSDLKNFAIFLFAGMIPWNFFSGVVTQSGTALITHEGLIKKIYLPKALFPLSIALALLVDSLLSFVALFIIILALGGGVSWALLFLPISFALLFILALGCGMIMAIATVFFRDLQHVTLIAMQGLFFLTPVLYKPETLAGKVSWLVSLNPVTPFIGLFRAPLVDGALPSVGLIFHSMLMAFAMLAIGLAVFTAKQKKIIFRL
jgi:ABC-type polysaccharide/polyol phosphate export permease